MVACFVDFGLLEPVGRDGPRLLFGMEAVLRVRTIQRLRRDLGVNLAGIAIILDLTERLRSFTLSCPKPNPCAISRKIAVTS